MDNLFLIQALAADHWLEAESDEEIFDKLRAVATVLIIGPNEGHTSAVANRRHRRQSLG